MNMLSGIKFVSRDQLLQSDKRNSGRDNSEGDDDKEDRRKKSSNLSKKIKKQKRHEKHGRDSSSEEDVDDNREKKKKKKRKKKSYSSDGDDYDSSEEEKSSSKRRGKEKLDKYERDSKTKKKKMSDEEFSEDDSDKDFAQKEDIRLARTELGLEWMLRPANKKQETGSRKEEDPQETKTEEVLKTNPKELNPYFKDNGSGYPDDTANTVGHNKLLSSSVVGDGGASWRLKALKRAKEQAAREGKKLNEVVEERWGSLGELASSVASTRVAPARAHFHAIKDRKKGQIETSEIDPSEKTGGSEKPFTGKRDYLHDVSSRSREMRKPRQDNLSWKRNRDYSMSSEDKSLVSAALSSLNKFPNDGSFMDKVARLQNEGVGFSAGSSNSKVNKSDDIKLSHSKDKESDDLSLSQKQVLNANQLAAKVLQLRMKGKHEEAEKLSKDMESTYMNQDADTAANIQENDEVSRRFMRKQMTIKHKTNEENGDLHLAKMIMKNKQYSLSGREEDEYGFDVASGRKRNQRRENVSDDRSIPKRLLTQQERCQFCFENPSRPRHLIVSIANFTYLMLPQWQPVVEGHCILLPMQHESSIRTIDKTVWEEIRNFKKCLLKMFAGQEKTLVFLETVIGLAKQRRHCLLECIPIPYERANLAPMYFKKAIEEAEGEWSQHEMKKVIPTSGNLRQVIPENFSYFHVEFGLDKGFVHVIDDDDNFNSGFGLNIVRGLLRLPEEDMYRRRRIEPMEKQQQAVTRFAQQWEPYDWTKEL